MYFFTPVSSELLLQFTLLFRFVVISGRVVIWEIIISPLPILKNTAKSMITAALHRGGMKIIGIENISNAAPII